MYFSEHVTVDMLVCMTVTRWSYSTCLSVVFSSYKTSYVDYLYQYINNSVILSYLDLIRGSYL
jgi:hypothetical protein